MNCYSGSLTLCITKYCSQCDVVLSDHVVSLLHLSLHPLLYPLIMTYKAKRAWQKSQAFFKIAWVSVMVGVRVQVSSLWSRKRKERWVWKKKLSALTFPPFSGFFVSVWTCSPWMKHKGSWGERPQDRCDRHTQIFSLELAVGATNPVSTFF